MLRRGVDIAPTACELREVEVRGGDLEGRVHRAELLERLAQAALAAAQVPRGEIDPAELPARERHRPWVRQLLAHAERLLCRLTGLLDPSGRQVGPAEEAGEHGGEGR